MLLTETMRKYSIIITLGVLWLWAGCAFRAEGATDFYLQGQGNPPYAGCHDKTITAPGLTSPAITRLRMKAEYPSGDEIYNTLIRFEDLIPPAEGLMVSAASLTLTYQKEDTGVSSATLDVYPCLRHWDDPSWDEAVPGMAVAWTTPGAQGTGTDRGELQTSFDMGYRNYPLTTYTDNSGFEITLPVSLIQSWLDDPCNNHGLVIVMNPEAATDVIFSSSEDTTLSYRPLLKITTAEAARVPVIVGLSDPCAESAIIAKNLQVGTKTQAYSMTVPPNHVISQNPDPCTLVPQTSEVDYVLSLGQPLTIVPKVIGDPCYVAYQDIEDACLAVGAVTYMYNPDKPADYIFDQDPDPCAEVVVGSAVDLWISKGAKYVSVPDVFNQLIDDANSIIEDACLAVGTVTYHYNLTIPINHVIDQDPNAGTTVHVYTPVNLSVSLGPKDTTVPAVIGDPCYVAYQEIEDACLVVGVLTYENSTTVDKYHIIFQDPVADTPVYADTTVDLVISLGPVMTFVPPVVGLHYFDAWDRIHSKNLDDISTRKNDQVVPKDYVIYQSPDPCMIVPEGSDVYIEISDGPQTTTVPKVVGLSFADAAWELSQWGLEVTYPAHTEYKSTIPKYEVFAQVPDPCTVVPIGTYVDLWVSLGPAATVPKVIGDPCYVAYQDIADACLAVGLVTYEQSETVSKYYIIDQDPDPCTEVGVGTEVDLWISLGPAPRTIVPKLIGDPCYVAYQDIEDACLAVGIVTYEFNKEQPLDYVFAQVPDPCAEVLYNTEVDVWISLGPPPWPDYNGDYIVNILDFAILAGDWLSCENVATDLTGDGCMGADDLVFFVEDWLSSQPRPKLSPDYNGDKIVNILDFALLAGEWLSCDGVTTDLTWDTCVDTADLAIFQEAWLDRTFSADISGDGCVDINDLLMLAEQWLICEAGGSADIFDGGDGGCVNVLDFAELSRQWGFCNN